MAELQIDPDLNIKQLNTENDKDWVRWPYFSHRPAIDFKAIR